MCISWVTERDYAKIETVDLPKCKYIGENAFLNCENLKILYLPKCENIEKNTFKNCVNLEVIYLTECNEIAQNAFDGCENLNKIVVPENCLYGSDSISKIQESLNITLDYVSEE